MPVIIFSTKGGMTYQLIEKRYPDTIHKFWVDIKKGLDLQVLLTVAATLGIN
jgi:succinyl-CoA synthetase beta subunit